MFDVQTSPQADRQKPQSQLGNTILALTLGLTLGLLIAPLAYRTMPIGNGAGNKPAEVVVVLQTATPSAQIAVNAQPLPTAAPSEAIESEAVSVPLKALLDGARDYTRLGKADAPVQIVVFSDAQCPFCKRLALEAEQPIIEQYVKTGKAAITYRHFAFLGPESRLIGQAMECAGEQHRFWDFHTRVFQNQLPENSGQATAALMLDWAKQTLLNPDKFATCMKDETIAKRIDLDTAAAQKLRLRGTPTLYINGKPAPPVGFEYLKGLIEGELGK